MAITVVGNSPSFEKEFNNTVSISDYTNKVLVPNKDTVAIPTDSLGANEDFSQAVITFYVLDAGTVVTSDWTISLSSSTDCTASISDITKAATVSAIAADTANFVVKASKTGESDLFRLITVYKAKEGTDGSSTPDSETIVLDGSSHLKVANHTLYDDDTEYSDTILIGFGGITSPNTTSVNSNNLLIQSDDVSTSHFSGSDNIIGIGSGIIMNRGLSTSGVVNTNGVLIGHDLSARTAYTVDNYADNFIVCGIQSDSGEIAYITNNTLSLGVDPTNKLEHSTSISCNKTSINTDVMTRGNNDRYFTSVIGAVGTSSSVNFDLDISALEPDVSGVIRDVITISGEHTLGVVYHEEVYMVITNDTAVINYSDSNKAYSTGGMATLSVTTSYVSGGTIRVAVTTTTEQGDFYIHHDIIAVG